MRKADDTHALSKWVMMASTVLALALLALPAYAYDANAAASLIGGLLFPSGH